MRKLLSLLIIFSVSKMSFSQNLKNFEGNFKGGKAKFQYYIGNQKDTIFHGKFSMVKEETKIETGKFKNNLKEGPWTYINTNKEEFINISGNYTKDLKDGVWNFDLIENGVEKKYSLHFINDTLIGKVWVGNLKGMFSETGKYIGNWNVEEEDFSFTGTFKDNIVVNLTQKKILNHSYFVEYTPDTSIAQFQSLTDEYNNIVRKTYNLVGITRVLVDDFEISKVYGIPDFNIGLIESLFYSFFDSIESEIDELFSRGWEHLKSFTLVNNPDLLYLIEETKEIQTAKINKRKDFERQYGPVFEYNQVDKKPLFSGGHNTFIEFILKNYNNAGTISGKVFLDFIIDVEGKVKVLDTKCSGNILCEEINRILQTSPKWEPAQKNGTKVNVRMYYPISLQKTGK